MSNNWPPDPNKTTPPSDQDPNPEPNQSSTPPQSPTPNPQQNRPTNQPPHQPPQQSPNQPPNQPQQPNYYTGQPYGGQEWYLLEKTLLASIEEQRRARRWRIFFRLFTLGYILLLTLLMAKGCSPKPKNSVALNASKPHIAVIDIQGVISADKDANSEDISESLHKAFDNENAKAVALRINSPGGSPVQSDDIWQTITDLRKEHPDKKVYAVIEDMGASGAYYIASASDEIWVNPSSLVGSIGVILPRYDVQKLMEKVGVQDGTMHSGEYKDILSMTRPMSDFEKNHVQSVLDNTHQHFINAVKQGRGNRLKDPDANHVFTGLFWSGEQAVNLGLADKMGSLTSLEKQLDIKDTVNYNPKDPVKELFGQFATQVGHGVGETLSNNMATKLGVDMRDEKTELK